ncbi:hypothetical protein [Modicisalibacter xianhensis]|uniref:EF-hand domain-containing protein n=1 Tax=Modicisalibacter xianhensis TaxID=442341 RepID=A0A1I2YPE1_9GAMM|nr:hypothetical protein [Halomonas xianhensis]SFH27415.1 hypothetical protein SAMN04487959_10258 [Halomonas xianhensis]
MKRNWINGLGGTFIAFSLLSAGSAFAQDAGFNEWDSNSDGVVDYEEFDAGFDDEGVFDSWDANDDNMLDENEFGEGVFNTYDEDGNGDLSEDEYGDFNDDAGDNGFWDV